MPDSMELPASERINRVVNAIGEPLASNFLGNMCVAAGIGSFDSLAAFNGIETEEFNRKLRSWEVAARVMKKPAELGRVVTILATPSAEG